MDDRFDERGNYKDPEEQGRVAKRMLDQVSALVAKRRRATRGRPALEAARTSAAERNQRMFGTDPSWYGR
jgi:hypothetical protein